ncbi:hypothetical protein RJ55_00315 [Drechmeria coniospora]|nr:hypothetical protein RJ55_00315 [Drechmeria coniospora]
MPRRLIRFASHWQKHVGTFIPSAVVAVLARHLLASPRLVSPPMASHQPRHGWPVLPSVLPSIPLAAACFFSLAGAGELSQATGSSVALQMVPPPPRLQLAARVLRLGRFCIESAESDGACSCVLAPARWCGTTAPVDFH